MCVNFRLEIFIYIQIPLAPPVYFLSFPRNEICVSIKKTAPWSLFCAIDCYLFNSHLPSLGCWPIQTSRRRTWRQKARSIVLLQGLDSSCQFWLVTLFAFRSFHRIFSFSPFAPLSRILVLLLRFPYPNIFCALAHATRPSLSLLCVPSQESGSSFSSPISPLSYSTHYRRDNTTLHLITVRYCPISPVWRNRPLDVFFFFIFV